jgi:hypothetical protein
MAEYKAVTRFSQDIINTLTTTLGAQELKIEAAYKAFETAIHATNTNLNDPNITKPALEAFRIECLAHLDRYATLCTEYKSVLESIDIEALAKVLDETPEGKSVGKVEVRKFLVVGVKVYWEWLRTEIGEEEVERLKRDVQHTVGIALALADEAEWQD